MATNYLNHPIEVWRADHANFGKLLDLLDAQLVRLHSKKDVDYELIRDVVYYMQEYSDRYHHPREDIAFSRLLDRDPALQLPINRLLQEHRVIEAAGHKVRDSVEQVLEDSVVPRESLETPLALYITFYRHRIGMEDAKLIPVAARMLTPWDWECVDEAVPPGGDPLFGDKPHQRFAELRKLLIRAANP